MRFLGIELRRAPREQRAFTIQDLARQVGFTLIAGNLDPAKVIQEGFQENAAVGAAVTKILTAAAQIPWVAQLQQADDELVDAGQDHPASRLLEHPSQDYGWGRIVEASIGNLLLFGEAYAYLNGADPNPNAVPGREPLEVLWIPQHWVIRDPRLSTYGDQEPVRINTPSGIVSLPRHRVVKICTWNPAYPNIGQSRIRPAASSIDASNVGRRWNLNLLRNGARPPGAFVTDEVLGQETFDRLKAEINEQYAGADRAGHPVILEGGLKYSATGLNAAEMEWMDGIREAKREIASVLGVDPGVLGDPEVKTYANYAEGRISLYEDTVLPLLAQVRDAFEMALRQWWPELRLYLDADAVPALRDANDARWERLASLVERGVLTRNEARAEMGYDDVEGGDEILVPLNLVPLQDAGGSSQPLGGNETTVDPNVDEPNQVLPVDA